MERNRDKPLWVIRYPKIAHTEDIASPYDSELLGSPVFRIRPAGFAGSFQSKASELAGGAN